jgi:hypothetical protein
LLSEALNALGVKDKHTRKEEEVQVAINTLPWPRSEIIAISEGEGLGAQSGPGQLYALVETDAFSSSVLHSTDHQIQMVGQAATSTSKHDFC